MISPRTSNIAGVESAESVNSAEVKTVNVALGNGKAFTIGIPGDWQSSIESAAELDAPTLRAVPVQGAHLILLMTFIPKRQTVGMDAVVLDKIMQGIHEQHAGNPAETRVASRAINPIFAAGVGHVLTYVDETLLSNQGRAAEDFAYMTTGALLIEGMVVSVSILSNGIESENYAKALLGVATLLYDAPTI
jgi:hypothetical protein